MNKLILLGLAATLGAANLVLAPQGASVDLQATSPGTAQTGHLNISGTATVGLLKSKGTVFGEATSPTGFSYGGFFTAASNQARGFYGYASSPTGLTYGGFFQNASESGRAVYGLATATTGFNYGGYFQTASTTGRGLLGVAAAPSGTTYGVYGTAVSPTGFGVYSDGNLHATGTISGNGSGLTLVNADLLDGLNSTAFLQAVPNPLSLVGVPAGAGTITGENGSSGSYSSGVRGVASALSGSTRGVSGHSSSPTGRGVFGEATALTGIAYGGRFESDSASGRGVYGLVGSASGQTFGGSFRSHSTQGTGVFGEAIASTGATYGVYGLSASETGRGVYGVASANAGNNYGGYFITDSGSGRGVYGRAPNNVGVQGEGYTGVAGSTTDGRGVSGFAYGFEQNYGILGQSNSQSAYGVFGGLGSSSGSGYGVYANGDSGASGTKSFRIDHPFDPENKYLVHYSNESPTPQNQYFGVIKTDSKGFAWVALPDYFEEINKDIKFQLTVVDESEDFILAKVSKKVQANRFQVRTSKPNVEVSWMVVGTRNDLYCRSKAITDVRPKEGSEVGTYQHPELYGFGPERRIAYDPKYDRQPGASSPVASQPKSGK